MPKLTTWHPTSRSWFLGIGIDNYKNFDKLSNAVKGVNQVKEILTKHYDIDKECVVTLLDKKATKENIVDTLDDLGDKVESGDKLIIFYAGHGHLNNSLELGYWIPIDAKKGKASSYLPNSTVRDYVKGIKAKHILLISDSCFSGSLFMQGGFRTSRALKELDSLPSRWAICSGRHDEEVYDGKPGENSPFTQSLINYLSINESESINVARLADHVIEQTAANYEQLPDGRPMFGVGHKGGQYIFWKKNIVKPVVEAKRRTAIATSLPERNAPSEQKPFYIKIAALTVGIAMLLFIGFKFIGGNDIDSGGDSVPIGVQGQSMIGANSAAPRSTKSSAPITSIDDAVIELFEINDYKGRSLKLYGDQFSDISNLSKITVDDMKFEDVISSFHITIPEGYEFILYEKRRHKGESIRFKGNGLKQDFPSIGSLQDKVSSFKLVKVAE